MGQDRHFFRVAIHGLEKGFVPEPEPEDVSDLSAGGDMKKTTDRVG